MQNIAKGGVVRDESARLGAVEKVAGFARSLGLEVRGQMESPLRGPKGNVEFLLHMAHS